MTNQGLSDLNARYEDGHAIEIQAKMLPVAAGRDFAFLTPMVPGMRDVLLFQNILINSGVLEFPPAGSLLRCEVIKAERGPRVTIVKGIERKSAHGLVAAQLRRGPEKMRVKFFSKENKYGFFMRDDGVDVFVHISTLERSGVRPEALRPDVRFSVEYEPSPKGFSAFNVVA